MEKKILSGREYLIFPPKEPLKQSDWPVVIVHGDSDSSQLLMKNGLLPLSNSLAVVILSEDRYGDYTPWPAKALNQRFPDFTGRADRYLGWIGEELLSELKKHYPVKGTKEKIGVLGQSLGGLVNLYTYLSPFRDIWSYAACISPSSWYPDFFRKFEENISDKGRKNWYISSGMSEGSSHNDLKKNTVAFTRRIINLLRENGNEVEEYWDAGQHHEFLADRYKRGLSWLDRCLL